MDTLISITVQSSTGYYVYVIVTASSPGHAHECILAMMHDAAICLRVILRSSSTQ